MIDSQRLQKENTKKNMQIQEIKIALLDMYCGTQNQSTKNILNLLEMQILPMKTNIFDVRGKTQIPSLDYDIYISTGGPGNPLENNGIWYKKYFELIDELWEYNQKNERKKYLFAICHSFQMLCNHFMLGSLTKRRSTSFGIFPIHKTIDGNSDPILSTLPDPFYAADSRDYQIIQPNLDIFEAFGAKILCLEKIRDHVEYERAIMAVSLSKEFFGTQFHPEADIISMTEQFNNPETYKNAIKNYGEAKVKEIISQLSDPYKINLTNRTIIPRFLKYCVSNLIDNQ